MSAYRALETSLGIAKDPVSINEFGVIAEEGVPGGMAHSISNGQIIVPIEGMNASAGYRLTVTPEP